MRWNDSKRYAVACAAPAASLYYSPRSNIISEKWLRPYAFGKINEFAYPFCRCLSSQPPLFGWDAALCEDPVLPAMILAMLNSFCLCFVPFCFGYFELRCEWYARGCRPRNSFIENKSDNSQNSHFVYENNRNIIMEIHWMECALINGLWLLCYTSGVVTMTQTELHKPIINYNLTAQINWM